MKFRRLPVLAITSRLFIIVLQYFSNIIIPDHNAHVFQYIRSKSEENFISWLLNCILSGFVRWDAEYFMHIAKYGYTYENTLAFFPLYPLLTRYLAQILHFCIPIANIEELLLSTFILCNVVLFILSVQIFHKLSRMFLNNAEAYMAAILFCFNPSSIFFTAPYTECLFSYLTFQSAYNSILLIRKYSKPNSMFSLSDTKIMFFISLSTLVRSNGLLNTGFLVYTILSIFITYFPTNNNVKLRYIVKYFCIIFFCCLVCTLPFILYQLYCYENFCTTFKADLPVEIINAASKHGFILPGHFATYNQSWCYNRIPLAYSYVQDIYWNVGFLRYYEFKQIPNFLLATPSLYIMISNCLLHLNINFKRLTRIFDLNELVRREEENSSEEQFFKLSLTVFVIHALFLSIFCMLCIHVQVTTRMICSATPIFYWYCAYFMRKHETLIKIYFGSYFVIGTILFCNCLPWT